MLESLLLIRILRIVLTIINTLLIEKDHIVTPIHTEAKPGTLYGDVADASKVDVSGELLDIVSRVEY